MDDDQIPVLNLGQLKVLSALGRGARGVVFLVQDQSSNGELFALKTILRASITKKVKKNDDCEFKQGFFEQEVLRLSQHPLLPKLRGVLSTENIVGYAIDYCPGRDLNYLRKKQTERMFSDDIIRFYAAELVIALEYLHGLGIVYRDLKPENVMIQENGHLMLVDFDLSTKLSPKSPSKTKTQSPKTTPLPKSDPTTKNTNRFSIFYKCCRPTISSEDSVHPTESINNSNSEPNQSNHDSFTKSNSFVGTEEYVSPEMLQGDGHGFSVDWWCLGIVLHEMLYGKTPFKGINRKETFYFILSKSPELVGEPTPLRDLIRKLLVKDPKQRISAAEIKGHDYFHGVDWENILNICRPPFVPGPSDQEEEEDMDVNNNNNNNNNNNKKKKKKKKIDIETFVQEVFEVDDDVHERERDHAFLVF